MLSKKVVFLTTVFLVSLILGGCSFGNNTNRINQINQQNLPRPTESSGKESQDSNLQFDDIEQELNDLQQEGLDVNFVDIEEEL